MTSANLSAPQKKKHLSSLTMAILTVSIIPLIIMGFGVFYLNKYKTNLIESAYQHMEQQTELISLLLQNAPQSLEQLKKNWPAGQSLYFIDQNAHLISTFGNLSQSQPFKDTADDEGVVSFTETFARFFLYLNPLQTSLPSFPHFAFGTSVETSAIPEIRDALQGKPAIAAWTVSDGFVLTIARPIPDNDLQISAIFMVVSGSDMTAAIDDVRKDIIKAFIIVIILTFLLSIYLSSFIAVPLKKLGRAAEDIRRGKRDLTDLPDLSKRKDEIGELSIILRQMTQALDNRIDAISNFAADVSHEIKNPLTSIRSAIETALIIKNPEKQKELLKIMENDVKRLDWLITDISRLSRLDAELAKDLFHNVNLNELLKNVADMWQHPTERGTEEKNQPSPIELILPTSSCYTLGKGDSLAQVFQNLFANALSFNPKNQPIRVTLSHKKDKLYIHVDDKGPGIPETHLQKIFDRFYTDRPADHDKVKNSGLGLSIAKHIIEAHRGEIFAENLHQNGKITGARFTVVLHDMHAA